MSENLLSVNIPYNPLAFQQDVVENFTEKEIRIIELIKHNPFITTNEMANSLGVSRQIINTIKKHLKEKNIVIRIDGDKGWPLRNNQVCFNLLF